MRIDGLPLVMTRSLIAALPKVLPADFPSLAREAAPQPASAPPGQPMPSVQMLVALAAADPGIERRRKLARDAERGLDMLEKLHTELVAGSPTPERLAEIVDWAQATETPDDPALAAILRDIDLRVRVELAKLDIKI